ncbi:MAG: hypothetical protein AABZ74_10050 [Cyanobacteriota bacterium]
MSNIKSKIMVFFVIFSLIFNFNSKGYSSVFETQKENNKIEIYSLDIKNNQTEFYQLFNNRQFIPKNNSLSDIESKIIINQIVLGYLNAYPSALIGMVMAVLVPLITFLIKNSSKNSYYSTEDDTRQALLYSLIVYLVMSFGISAIIYDQGSENTEEKWEGNFWLTFLATFSSTILFLVGALGVTYLESTTKETSTNLKREATYTILFILLFPLYMTFAGVIGYHLTKKELRNKNDEILYNKKDDFAKIEEFNKEFLAFSQKININNDKITFNVFSF